MCISATDLNQPRSSISGGGNPDGSCYKDVKKKAQNLKPRVPSSRRHIGMVMIFVATSSTMRDFPVPDELTMLVCLE